MRLCKQRGTLDDAHGLIAGQDGQCATDSSVRNRVIIFVEAHVGSLPCTHLDALVGRKRRAGKRQQKRTLALPDFAYRERMILRVPTLSRNGLAEGERLGIEIRKVCVRPRRKERGAKIANGSLDSPFFISFGDPDGTRLEPIVCREVPKGGMEANGVAHALQNCRLEIVVQEDFGNAAKERKSVLVASKKETLGLSQKEANKQHAGVAEHLLQQTRSGESGIALEHLAKVRNERIELARASHHRSGKTVGH